MGDGWVRRGALMVPERRASLPKCKPRRHPLTPHNDVHAVRHEAARHASADGIVSRDPLEHAKARLSVYTPDELLAVVKV